MKDAAPIGLVGAGLLGSALAGVLLERGHEVVGYDVDPERTVRLASRGGRAAGSAAQVARQARHVFVVVADLPDVEAAIRGPGGVLEGASPGTVIVQMSTISPQLAVRLDAAARDRGVTFLDAPVSGTSGMVARRDCVITVGCAPEAFAASRPLLAEVASHVHHVGPCGSGSLLKLVTNLVMGLNSLVVAEGLTMARRAGLDLAQTVEILSQGAAASKMLEVRGPLMVERRFEPLMKVELFLKDIRLILQEAQAHHVPLPLTGTMQQLCTAASAAGHGGDDLAVVVRVLEAMAGLDVA
jgi:3-hydroxyisobutyrate dehydrogenase-like beta-hydroxyacid dehydrogenase